jgi:hypothetical protein
MNKIFIIWHDYDGCYVEEFDDGDKAEKRISELLKDEATGNAVVIDAIIEGKRLEYDAVQYASVVKLKQHE